MTLERCLALIFFLLASIYAYTAFFTMDASLPPFAKNSPIWPSTFPKVIGFAGLLIGLSLIVNSLKQSPEEAQQTIDELRSYEWKPVFVFIALMVAFALLLRPMGFIISSTAFLTIGATILGERRVIKLLIISAVFAFGIWYLVQEVLGIFLRPWPGFLTGMGG